MQPLLKTLKLTVAVAAVLGLARAAAAQELGEADCSTLGGQAAAMCRDALQSNAASSTFLRLGELLRERRNLELAVKVYSRGVRLHPNNSELRAKLTVARSGLEEQQWMQQRQQEAGEELDAKTKAEVYKCKNLAKSAPGIALPACEAALAAMPQDPQLLEAKGDALLKQGQPAEAYQVFAAAAKQASTPALNDKLSALAQYKPKPEPEPEKVAKTEPSPEPEPEKTAKAEPSPEPEPEKVAKAEPPPEPGASQSAEAADSETTDAASEPSNDETSQTDAPEASDQQPEQDSEENRRAVLVSAANDPGKPLKERLEARNMLMSMRQQPDN